MKVSLRPRKQKRKADPLGFNARLNTYSLSRAKTYLGRLADKAVKGEPVYIVRGTQRFILQQMPEISPIPMRPPAYFAGCYSTKEIQEENRLGAASVVEKPGDLE
jgi:hypothetical protein